MPSDRLMLQENVTMTHAADPHSLPSPPAAPARRSIPGILVSPVLWGGLVTIGLYQLIPHLPVFQAAAQRYLCSHPLEYTLVALFCIGATILLQKAWQIACERSALKRCNTLPDIDPADRAARAASLADQIDAQNTRFARRLQSTHFVDRLTEACHYVKSRNSARGLEEHLKYLAEVAAERVHESYSLLQTINWAVPIIGFLGTVVGITLAIAKVTPEELDSSLNDVTGGLAIAFDTTTVALSFSLVLVFGYQFAKRAEGAVLVAVEQFGLRHLLPLFSGRESDVDPLHRAQTQAARELLDRTESLIHEQTHLWRHSMDGLRQRWADTLASQQQQLSGHLADGMQSNLSDHAGQLQVVRAEFLEAFTQASAHISQSLADDAAHRDEHFARQQVQFADLWQQMRTELHEVVRTHDAHLEDTIEGLTQHMREWQQALEVSSQIAAGQMETLRDHTHQLSRMADQEEHLARLQEQLTHNLNAVRTAETFEQTLNHLTAAVHLLTARTRTAA